MGGPIGELFINIHLWSAIQISLLGFIGGVLSGFIGSGGAFFMTPGMMNWEWKGLSPWQAMLHTSSARP